MFFSSFIRNKLHDGWAPILIVSILVLAFIVRVNVALRMDITFDEIPHVYWIGSWFSRHFGEYFFQLQHNWYPPHSPLFANPPFGVWILTIGIYVSQSFGYNILLGARITNVVTGVILCFATYIVGKTFLDKKIGLLAAGFYALNPQAVAADARAYLDTALSLLTLISFYYFYLYSFRKRKKYLIYSSITFGLALLTKFQALYLWISILLICLCIKFGQKYIISTWKVLLHGIIGIAVAISLWAGLRDIDHVWKAITYRINPPRLLAFPYDVSYPFKLLFFQTCLVVNGLLAISLLHYANRIARKSIDSSRIFLLISFLTTFAFNGIFSSTFHILVPVLPYAFILASDTVFYLIAKIHPIPILKRIPGVKVVPLLLIILQSFALFSMRIGYTGMYTNILYSLAEGQIRVGDGEGMKEAAEWVKVNVPTGSKICVFGSEWILHFYLTEGDTEWNNYPYSAGWITTTEPSKSVNITHITQTYDCVIIHTSYLLQGSPYSELLVKLQKAYGKPDFIVWSNCWHQIAIRGYLTPKLFTDEPW